MGRSSIYPPSVKPGIPHLGSCPPGWRTVTFGDVLEEVDRLAKLDDDTECQLVNAKRSRGGIVPRERLRGKDILTKSQFYIKTGDFLISRRQIIHGACGIVPPELDGAIVSNEYSAFRVKDSISSEYLSYYTHTIHFQQSCFHSSVGVDVEKMIFKVNAWLEEKLYIPPREEQQAIVDVLSNLDELIAKTRQIIDVARRVKYGLLESLMSFGINEQGQLRDPKRDSALFKQSCVGLIPATWTLTTLGECGTWRSGGTPDTGNPQYWGGPIPWITSSSLHGPLLSDSERRLTEAGVSSGSRLVPIGTILFVVRGMSLKSEFRVGMAARELAFGQDCKAIEVCSHTHPDFLLFYLGWKEPTILNMVDEASHGTGRLMTQELQELLVLLPPLEEQRAISDRIWSVERTIACEEGVLAQLSSLRQGCLQELLSGCSRLQVKL